MPCVQCGKNDGNGCGWCAGVKGNNSFGTIPEMLFTIAITGLAIYLFMTYFPQN